MKTTHSQPHFQLPSPVSVICNLHTMWKNKSGPWTAGVQSEAISKQANTNSLARHQPSSLIKIFLPRGEVE